MDKERSKEWQAKKEKKAANPDEANPGLARILIVNFVTFR